MTTHAILSIILEIAGNVGFFTIKKITKADYQPNNKLKLS